MPKNDFWDILVKTEQKSTLKSACFCMDDYMQFVKIAYDFFSVGGWMGRDRRKRENNQNFYCI
jgi:hypothetical protein